MTTKKANQKSAAEKPKSKAKKTAQKKSPVLEKGKEVVGDVLAGAASSATVVIDPFAR